MFDIIYVACLFMVLAEFFNPRFYVGSMITDDFSGLTGFLDGLSKLLVNNLAIGMGYR